MKTTLLILLPTLFTINLYSQECFYAEKEGMDGYYYEIQFATGSFDFEAPKSFKGTYIFNEGGGTYETLNLTEKKRTVIEKAEGPADTEVIEIVFNQSYEDMPEEKTEVKFVFIVSGLNGGILILEKTDATYGKISFDYEDCPE